MNKNAKFLNLIQKLLSELGDNYYIKDYWETDLNSIGIKNKLNKDKLVYISNWNTKKNTFYLEIEDKPKKRGQLYSLAAAHDNINFEELKRTIINQFGNTKPKGSRKLPKGNRSKA